MDNFALKISALLLFIALSGCASGLNYKTLDEQMNANDCKGATAYLESQEGAYGKNMRLNYLLDSAIINMQCGNYNKSNSYFHDAETLAEQLWTKSVSSETAAFVTNDYAIPYAGEDFERAGINLFSAISYALDRNNEEALVECRRLDSVLSMYNDKYEEKNVYKEDAFGRYLSGMIYEAEGELEDAYIDYYKSFKIYGDYKNNYGTMAPVSLKKDLIRLARATGRYKELLSEFSDLKERDSLSYGEAQNMGKVVLIHLNGKSPVKVSSSIVAPSTQGPISLAFPKYVVNRPNCSDSKLIVRSSSNTLEAETELVEDINEIAVKNLDDRKGRVIVKAIARAALKQAAANNLIQDDNLREVFNVFNAALMERADTRTWRTLPGEVNISRVYLKEGTYNISGKNCGREEHLQEISIKAGETRFLLFDTMY
ncbi:MAG: hypothetical protein RQ824_08455 [bacterium]|nr:hypothetical protein [bacterium]